MTKKKTYSIVVTALAANALHFALCYLFNFLYYRLSTPYHIYLSAIFGILMLLLWFAVGAYYRRSKTYTVGKGLGLAIVSALPILLFILLQAALPVPQDNATQSWLLFFSFGAPIVFWLNPLLFFSSALELPFWLSGLLCVALLIVVTFIGSVSTKGGKSSLATDTPEAPKEDAAAKEAETKQPEPATPPVTDSVEIDVDKIVEEIIEENEKEDEHKFGR